METIIAFLASNKAAIGAVVSVFEGFVSAKTKGEVDAMLASPSIFKGFLWAANPFNLFRKPR